MARNRTGVTRREFLQRTALASGAVVLAGVPVSAAQAGQAEPKIGAQLIGKLEGPSLVLDPATWPKSYGEAPALAELVKAGKLPPVTQRIPEEPMVVKPLHSIGKYGGNWRRAFTGPGDGENGNRIVATDKILFWDYTGTKVMPCLARDWRLSDDGKVCTIFLRKGHKWSDGQPFTADDFVFWFEDIYLNKDLQPTPDPFFMVNGKPGRLYKRDDHTVVFEFPESNYMFVDVLAGSTTMGGGQAREQHLGRTMGAYMPAHYLKQFHPKHIGKEEADRKAKAAGFDGWLSYLKNRWDWRLNTDLPVLGPWKTVTPINTPTWALERNPFYYGVDSEGNQLPYIDRITMGLAENLEVVNLRAIAGQYDFMERHTSLGKLPVFLENRAKGNYTVHLDPALNGGDAVLHTNQAYEGDPEIQKWILTRDFRRALSMGIDRDQLNETFWLGVGTPGSVAPSESAPENPGPEWRKKWSVLDVKQANQLLDKIGIQTDVKDLERNLFFTKIANNEHQIAIFINDGSEQIYLYPRYALPVDPIQCPLGHPIARWYASDGKQGKPPKDPELLRALELFKSAPGKKAPERRKIAQEIWKILVDGQFSIGTVGLSPAVMGVRIVSKRMGNIPARQVNAQHARTPCSSHPATFFFKA